jgi:hypothetical protein
MREILAKLNNMDRARHVWLELGRRLLSGEVKPEQSKDWTERELARQEADPPA